MILAVDAGNTAVTLGCVEGREILNLARLAASPGRSADEYAVLMERVLSLRGVKLREFEGAAIASVVPPLTEVLREAVRLITATTRSSSAPGSRPASTSASTTPRRWARTS